MKVYFSIIAVVISALVLGSLPSGGGDIAVARGSVKQSESNRDGEIAWPHRNSDLEASPEIHFGRLDNGIRYILMENANPEDRASMHLNVQVGSYHEKEEERGIAHFLEHMLFLGSQHFETGELVKYFQRIGMKFGPDVNARTGFFHTIYDIDLPEATPDNLSEALLVLRDYAAGGRIPAEEVDRERQVILSEKNTRDSPSYRTFKETLAFEMPGTRVTKRFPIGTREVIRNADRDRIKTFYETWYRPENLVIVMVGDFDPQTAEKHIADRFSDIAPRTPEKKTPEFGNFEHTGVKPFYHLEPESGDTRVSIKVATRKDLPGDNYEYRKNRLLEQMANRIVNYRLDTIADSPDAPFTQASSRSGYSFRHVRGAEISARCAPENWEGSMGALEKTLRKALSHGFTESETNRVKNEFRAMLERNARAAPTRESSSIARQFLNDLNRDRVLLLDECRLSLLAPVIESATPEKLHEALKDAWRPEHRLLLVTGTADLIDGGKAPENRIRQVFEESRTHKVQKPDESDTTAFPYIEKPDQPGIIKAREDLEDIGVIRVVFENGTTLFVKKTDFKADEVLASLRFGEGKRSEPADKEGIAEIAQRVVNLSGLGAMDRQELRRALSGTNTDVSFSVEPDAFTFSGRSVTDETELLFELLYAHTVDPGYRESARARALNQFESRYESLVHSIEGAFQLKGRRFLAGGDTRFGLPAFEAMAEHEISDIEDWLEGAKNKWPKEIAVAGDIDPEKVIGLAASFFGALPAVSDAVEKRDERGPVFPEGERLARAVPTRMERSMLLVSYPTEDMFDISRTRRLSVLSDIFADRMRIRIRDELGAAYSQGSHSRPSRAYEGYGLFNAHAIIDPGDHSRIENEIKTIAEDLQNEGITEDELERAINPILAGINRQTRTNAYWLDTVLKGASRHPAQLEWSRTIFMDYASITEKEINRVAEKYLENERSATLRFYPDNGDTASETGEPGKKKGDW